MQSREKPISNRDRGAKWVLLGIALSLGILCWRSDRSGATASSDAKTEQSASQKSDITPLARLLSRTKEYSSQTGWEQPFAQQVDRLLSRGADPNALDEEGKPILILAIQKSHISTSSGRLFLTIVNKLLQKKADPNARDREGKTALLWSAWSALGERKPASFPETMRLLIKAGARISPSRNDGWSILNWAAYFGDIKIALKLLTKGLTVNTYDENGRTALHVATSQQKADFVRFLLKRGANVNSTDNFGVTPLMLAVQNDDAEMCQLLLQHGANRQAREKNTERTAERLARYLHAERCLALFRTGKVMPPVVSRALSGTHVSIDANRWLDVRPCSHGKSDYLVQLLHRDGRHTQVDTFFSGRPLLVNVFRDADGTSVAFVRWDDQGGGAALYRLEGMKVKAVWDEGSRYGSGFRPLKTGGCVVWTWRPAFQMTGMNDPLADDNMCLPFYYRNGKYTELEGIYFPGCLKQR